MAHHNNTPASVLEAPKLAPKYFVQHIGPNRAQRRGKQFFKPGPATQVVRNTPFRSDWKWARALAATNA
jgi:hypothetical protein